MTVAIHKSSDLVLPRIFDLRHPRTPGQRATQHDMPHTSHIVIVATAGKVEKDNLRRGGRFAQLLDREAGIAYVGSGARAQEQDLPSFSTS